MARSGLSARVVIDQCRFDARYRGQLQPGRRETQQVEPADIGEGDTVPGFDAAVDFRQSGMLRYRPTRVAMRVQAGDEMGDGIANRGWSTFTAKAYSPPRATVLRWPRSRSTFLRRHVVPT